jgi:glycerophosphoryl diester phosphodiesterase
MKTDTLLFIVITLICFSCSNLSQLKKGNMVIDKQGHRGCRGLMPENTIPAFLKAVDLGVNTLEMDLVITRDNKVLVSHEPFFNHEITTLPNGELVLESNEKELNIYKMDYSEVIKYDVGSKVHPRFTQQLKMKVHKPLLSEVIDSVELYSKENHKPALYYNIETKKSVVLHFESATFEHWYKKFSEEKMDTSDEMLNKIPFIFYKESISLIREGDLEKCREYYNKMKVCRYNPNTWKLYWTPLLPQKNSHWLR